MTNLHPGLILILTGILVFCLPQKVRRWIALGGAFAALGAMVLLSENASITYGFTEDITMELLHVDPLSRAFGLILCITAVIAGIYSLKVDDRGEKTASLIYAGSSICVVFAGDWITLICFWETMAISSWYLVWCGKTRKAVRASYRYLVMHLFGGNLLLGGAMYFCIEKGFSLELLTGSGGFAAMMVLIGICINAGVPPFHTWIADAYPESTVSGTVYMGSYTTKVAIYALIRLFAGTQLLVPAGAVMAVFGACMALIENDLRRILSYHIVSQLGFMVAALGTGSIVGLDGAALQAIYHIMYKSVLLMGAGAVITATGKRKITELSGLGRKMPVTAVCFLIASLAIAGMPFLNGFASKTLIMASLKDYTAAYWLITVAGVGTWLSVTLKINYFVFWGKKGVCAEAQDSVNCANVPVNMQIAMILGTLLCIITGLMPEIGYSMMPGRTMGHPFTLEHILEYIGLFIGATVPFAVFLKKMAPHDVITLDFDWLYRRGLAPLLTLLSRSVHGTFCWCERVWNRILAMIGYIIKNPSIKSLSRLTKITAEDYDTGEEGTFEGDVPVGAFMQIFVVFCVVAFIVIIILE